MPVFQYTGNQNDRDGTVRILLDETNVGKAKRFVDLNGLIELTETEAEELGALFKLKQVDDYDAGTLPKEQRIPKDVAEESATDLSDGDKNMTTTKPKP